MSEKHNVDKTNIKKVIEIATIEELASLRHSKNVNAVHEENLSFGDRVADKMADIAGSWVFIISFVCILLFWVITNSVQLFFHLFDPFPFILLNLVLSCVAALEAPVIMMSQNRQEKKDRIRAEHDYEVNLKAEILIEELLKRMSRLEENQQEVLRHLNKQVQK